MNKTISCFLSILLLFTITHFSLAQNKSGYSEENILSKSYILIDIEKNPFTFKLDSLLSNSSTPLAFEISKTTHLNHLKKYVKHRKEVVVITQQNIDSLLDGNLSVFQIPPDKIETIHLNSINNRLVQPINTKKLTRTHLSSTKHLINFWDQYGKRPNFIEINSNLLVKADSVVSYLNSLKTISGTIKTDAESLINDVKFIKYKSSTAGGYFNFPIINEDSLPILIPYKAGYHFSPDIIHTTEKNLENLKNFKAFQLDLNFGLSDYYVFDPKFKNKLNDNSKGLLINNVKFKKDSTRGNVGFFKNGGYIDTGIESKNSLRNSFTISAWIKPTSLGIDNSILGKGESFAVKLRNGFLTFTMTRIKDYISRTSPIPLNKWSHIALVHSQIDNSLFFYVNGKLTEKVELISEYVMTSDYNIHIGTNLWEEFFEGYLDEIKIWERELNEKEVSTLFKSKAENSLNNKITVGLIIFGTLLIIIFILFFKHKSKNLKKHNHKKYRQVKKEQQVFAKDHENRENESILCFGKLKILDKDGQDIAENFSPLLKKLFIVILLHSHQNNKKGISTKQLTEFLWPGMSPQKAKNTRGTNTNNLRSRLRSCPGINLVFKDKFWFIELSENCYYDYLIIQNYLDDFLINEFSVKELEDILPTFLTILKTGRLFSGSSESWLDPFIEKFSNQIIEQCLDFIEILDKEKHCNLLLLLTDVICIYDDLNEKAHSLKLQLLIQQGKLSLAYKAYDNFVKLYYKIYKETYAVSFEDMTSS
ncbi:LamG domain-containing protein [Flavivirga spongiicola]|uniref:LamG-like jellyroll fold domain-containing protein n=1 Tax=Flavivirga spongiicola TaxID=421621 RepID=A0ABU7XNU1_9FLAO|nr:LamG-like jellyroll fold domain-containing protein [Flavivirga sp. MEBiC05379]MDO5981855.1 LamG-like jellyroll fold domain-containing protein [Flavivirga sp. MEBiC05379]